MFRRRNRIAAVRVLKLRAPRPNELVRRISMLVSLAVRVGSMRAQVAWLCVSIGALTALYFESKIELPKPRPPTTTTAPASHGLVLDSAFLRLDVDDLLVFDPLKRGKQVPETYGSSAFGSLALPAAALVVALLVSWQRKKRRLLRVGCQAEATIREIGTNGSARGAEVELWFPIAGTDRHGSIVTIRPPDRIGETEAIIYDPALPDRAIALADLPGQPRLVDNALRLTRVPVLQFLVPLGAVAMLATLAVQTIMIVR